MLKKFFAGQPAVRFQHHHLPQKIQLDLVQRHRQLLPTLTHPLQLPLSQTLTDQHIFDLPQIRTNYRKDILQLLQLVVSPEEGLPCLHEVENATQSPDIYFV